MKLIALLSLLGVAQACIRIRALQANNPTVSPGTGSMLVQIWENSNFYDQARQEKERASSDDSWVFNFPADGGDYFLVLRSNGREGYIERRFTDGRRNAYTVPLVSRGTTRDTPCEAFSPSGNCAVEGSYYETVFDDGFGNCNQYPSKLCGYWVPYCPH